MSTKQAQAAKNCAPEIYWLHPPPDHAPFLKGSLRMAFWNGSQHTIRFMNSQLLSYSSLSGCLPRWTVGSITGTMHLGDPGEAHHAGNRMAAPQGGKMSTYYDQADIPDALRRSFDVYDR